MIVGDLLDADIAGANAIGATGVLVLTGSTTRAAAAAAEGALRPDLVIDNLYQLPYGQPAGALGGVGRGVQEPARVSGPARGAGRAAADSGGGDPHLEITEIADRVMKAGGRRCCSRTCGAATFRWRSICLDHSNE